MKKTFLIPVLLLTGILTRASYDFNANCRNAYHHIARLEMEDAAALLAAESRTHPGNGIPVLLRNYIDFITIAINDDEDAYKRLMPEKNKRIQQLSGNDDSSPWHLYSQADIMLQWAFVRLKFGDFISAGLDINRAYKLLTENDRRFPGFLPDRMAMGLLHALIGTVPGEYRWMMKPFELEGSVKQGTGELETFLQQCLSGNSYSFLLPEAAMLYSGILISASNDKAALEKLVTRFEQPALSDWVRQSQLMRFAKAAMLVKAGNADAVISLLSDQKTNPRAESFYFLDYMLGLAKLTRLDPDAHLFLLRYTGNFRGKSYIRTAYERLAWHYLIHGQPDKYDFYMNRVRLRGNDRVDSDKQAYDHALNHYKPDIFLLKARLLSDGGYYQRALDVLASWKQQPARHETGAELEYTYRTARIYDNWGKNAQAKEWYLKAMKSGESSRQYYAANSALHMGMLCEQEGDFKKAAEYFRTCLDMDFDEYRFSIRHKAMAGLNRVTAGR